MKCEREILDKISELSNSIRNENDAFVRGTLLAHQTALKWVLKDS